jgi:hypothetical protein
MTNANIAHAFRTAGVYLLNRDAIKFPIKSSAHHNLAQDCGIAYIPLYSPAKIRQRSILLDYTEFEESPQSLFPQSSSPSPACSEFTEEEHKMYKRRWENGYDLYDEQYNLWLKLHNPTKPEQLPQEVVNMALQEEEKISQYQPYKYRSSFQKFLTLPSPPKAASIHEQLYSHRVITSEEYILKLEEKQ